jgi:putative membrane protein
MTNSIEFKKAHRLVTYIGVAVVCLMSVQGTPIHNAGSLTHSPKNQYLALPDTVQNENDAVFLAKVAEINLDEILLGEQAQQKSKMDDIRDFGKMLKDDHTASLQELTALAGKKAITIPQTADMGAQDAHKKFDNASGPDFDIEYIDMMVAGHQKAIALFENEAKTSGDNDVRAFATKTLPVLHKHLAGALALQKKYQK